jgi:hypothetical protein
LTRIDQSLWRLSLSFTRCNSRIPRDLFGCCSAAIWIGAVLPHRRSRMPSVGLAVDSRGDIYVGEGPGPRGRRFIPGKPHPANLRPYSSSKRSNDLVRQLSSVSTGSSQSPEHRRGAVSQALGIARRREPRPAPPRPGSPNQSPRPPRPGLRLVHRRFRHARSQSGEGAARGSQYVRNWQCALKARIISGGGFHPDNCQ